MFNHQMSLFRGKELKRKFELKFISSDATARVAETSIKKLFLAT